MPITIRDARPEDREAILALVPRLRAFGPSDLRSVEHLDGAESDALSDALASLADDAALIVAEVENTIAGVAFMQTHVDYFTHERHAHLGILSVSELAEGKGVGRALLKAVDDWAGKMGYRFITLNVFAGNHRARQVYERAGYEIDAIKYAKVVDAEP